MRDFSEKVAVITGGASGVGRALAVKLAQGGARVVIADINADAIAKARQELARDGLVVDGMEVDVTSSESVNALAERVFGAYENVHLLFNNAGVGIKEAKRRIWTLDEKDWQWGFAVNVMGVANGIRAFVPTMLERGEEGHVVNTTSGNGGLFSLPTTPVYASSKAAVTSLTEVLHSQFLMDKAKLQAHLLYPGPNLVNTNILNSDQNRPEAFKKTGEAAPGYVSMEALAKSAGVAFKLTEPEEVADMALDGVRAGRFWILSKEGTADKSLKRRTQSILERENPVLPGRA
jgi:NAD(P)-dependent dehydrogenase (short-subunit alcohol dehydrogenase family)